MPGARAKGVDPIGPRGMMRLPGEALHSCTDLLDIIETEDVWPPQVMASLAAMGPKKAEGDRVLGVLPHIARTWSRIRGAASDDWIDGLHDFWCTAMKGSSALSAAPHRAFLDESA
eukprot:1377302-Pyramimonas_sp.AAC.1